MGRLTLASAFIAVGALVSAPQKDAHEEKPTLRDTLRWMETFSGQHGFLSIRGKISQVNTISPSDGCKVVVDHRQPGATEKNVIRRGVETVSLSDFDPGRVKVTKELLGDTPAFEITFERSDSEMAIEQNAEMGDGTRTKFWFSQESLFFDSEESANRFADALRHGIVLCGGAHSVF